ncbi:MAG: hypothetical protein A3H35_07275 [Betaproteobacteria bacterium RIFCSPLOWO2_02_FULL_62_17]|nr:MAG: hypothetical protein A3H35_07275 [Betaproteobacteria bacterium RIFCSPLOWO2_02_FULL_62_17]
MSAPSTIKYGFRIRTRHGLVVENLSIHGRDEAEAERKLRQMYHNCQIMECVVLQSGRRADLLSFEDVISLISK